VANCPDRGAFGGLTAFSPRLHLLLLLHLFWQSILKASYVYLSSMLFKWRKERSKPAFQDVLSEPSASEETSVQNALSVVELENSQEQTEQATGSEKANRLSFVGATFITQNFAGNISEHIVLGCRYGLMQFGRSTDVKKGNIGAQPPAATFLETCESLMATT
jgi:hypothetical protein